MEDITQKRIKVNIVLYWIGKIVYKITGWRVEGKVPDIPKFIMIVAPHTSNWDFPVGLMASFSWRYAPFWIAKHSLFRWPLGGVLKRLGGIPINRAAAQNFIEQAAQFIEKHKNISLVITPEGTRKRVDKWKNGFYYIAKKAKVPIVCAYLDFKRKVCGIGPVIIPSDSVEADMQIIRDFYLTIAGKRPENFGEIRISLRG
jgi:1-acyl-sn-glycerol-3-phosphate acyltransferase